MKQIEEMPLAEIEIRTEAYQLQEIEKQRDISLQAWLNQVAKSTTGSADNPQPKYKHFKDLFDYQKAKK